MQIIVYDSIVVLVVVLLALTALWQHPPMHYSARRDRILGIIIVGLSVVLAILCALVLCGTAEAADDWYVRPGGGSYGLEDGTSYANAFDGFDNIVWGAGAGQVGPGDTLWICGPHGNYSSGYLGAKIYMAPTVSGESGNPITIRCDCSTYNAEYDDGYVVSTSRRYCGGWTDTETNGVYSINHIGSHWNVAVYYDSTLAVMNSEKDVADIATWADGDWGVDTVPNPDVLYVKPLAAADPNPNNDCYMMLYGNELFSFDNNNVDYIDLKNGTFYGGSGTNGHGFIQLDGCDYINIDNNKFYWQMAPIWSTDSDYGTFTNNIQVGGGFGPYLFRSDHWTVSGNDLSVIGRDARFTSNDNECIVLRDCSNDTVEENEIYEVAGMGISLYYAADGTPFQNNIVRYNLIHDIHDVLAIYDHAENGINFHADNAGYNPDHVSGNEIYGNIIWDIDTHWASWWSGVGIYIADAGYGWRVSNNIVYDAVVSWMIYDGPDNGTPGSRWYNNISLSPSIYHVANEDVDGDSWENVVSSNNLFYPDGKFDDDGTERANLAAWIAGWAGEGITVETDSLTDDPLFVAATGDRDTAEEFAIQDGSPARGAGVTVSGLTYTDYWGDAWCDPPSIGIDDLSCAAAASAMMPVVDQIMRDVLGDLWRQVR